MKVEALQQWCEDSKNYPNYQHKDLSWEEFDKLAEQAWDRFTDTVQDKVTKVCGHFGLEDKILIRRSRFMAQTNLFGLCKLLEKYKDVSLKTYQWLNVDKWEEHNTHEEICNKFFVRKNPIAPNFKEFAANYKGNKERLLLVPRGGFKSSIDMADTVQWIACWPEVTVLILTGVLDLAKDFVKEIKSHFELEDADDSYAGLYAVKKGYQPRTMPDGSKSLFQILFAEHCIPREEGKATEFQTPASTIIEKECTVFAASIDQNLSGWHVGVMKLDDVVTNENSRTVDRIKAINKQVSINNAMLHPYGFYDKIGTWYDAEDTYGQDIKLFKKCAADHEEFPMDIYLRAAWWPNEEAVKLGKIEEELQVTDRVLWFNEPGQLTYDFLRKKQKSDPEGFAIKYLNDPLQAHRVKFPRELLVRKTIPANAMPQQGMIVTCVDTAYSVQSWADYTVILTVLIYAGRFFIIDMKRDRYNEYQLPQVIATAAFQWKPRRICIEDSMGVKWLGREIYKEMDKLHVRVPLEFVPLGFGSKSNAKDMKAKPVLRYLGDDRLFFSQSCAGLEALYDELEKFGTAAGTHDDIVSALSILVAQFGSYADMEAKFSAAQSDFVVNPREKFLYDHVHGGKTDFETMLDAQMEQPKDMMEVASEVGYIDPLADLMG